MVTHIDSLIGGHWARDFTLIFDCGSVNREHFKQGLDALDGDTIDVLFISHLDADHVNGLDLLLGHVTVDSVVLPCLDEMTIVATSLAAADEDDLSGTFVELLSDPAAWLRRRGVRRVLFVQRGLGPDTPGIAPDQIFDGGIPPIKNQGRRRNSSSFTVHSNSTEAKMSGDLEVVTLAPACHLVISTSADSAVKWLLVPFYHPFSPEKVSAFRRALSHRLKVSESNTLSSRSFTQRLLTLLRNEGTREEIRTFYKILSADNNKPSLSLYSGPVEPNRWRIEHRLDDWYSDLFGGWVESKVPIHLRVPGTHRRGIRGPGWLTTGDADLRGKTSRDAWLARYRALMPTVGAFVLPHHGSNASLHDDVIDVVEDSVALTCAARGRSLHPHPRVIERLRARHIPLWQVSEEIDSEFVMRVYTHT